MKRDAIESYFRIWLQKRVIDHYIQKIQPSLPFIVEKFDIDASWSDFKKGKISGLKVVLRWDPWRIRLDGPLNISQSEDQKSWKASYLPSFTIEPAQGLLASQWKSDSLPLNLWIEIQKDLSHLTELGLTASAPHWKWNLLGLDAQKPDLQAHWDVQNTQPLAIAKLSLEQLSYSQNENSVQISHPKIEAQVPLTLEPFLLGSKAQLDFKAKNSEILLGKLYLDLPMDQAPAHFDFDLGAGPTLQKVGLTVGKNPKVPDLEMSASGNLFSEPHLRWKTADLSLAKLIPVLTNLAELSTLTQYGIKEGTIALEGQSRILLSRFDIKKTPIEAKVVLKKLGLYWEEASTAVRGLNLSASFDSQKNLAQGHVSANQVYFKKFKGTLDEFPFKLTLKPEVRLSLPQGVPLKLDGLPMSIGPTEGTFPPSPLFLLGAFHAKNWELSKILEGICFKGPVPPAKIEFSFPKVEFTNDWIDPTGEIHVDFFDGKIVINEIGFYNLSTEVIETDFDSRWEGIKLDQLGAWLGFGEMDGILRGYAMDVVFQSWLPTQFNFKTEVKPYRHADVVFSPDAMRNFVRLFAGPDIDNLPGFANWLAFGWPSRVFGGYDVDYAGISLFSKDGSILVETLDPDKILSQERKHFILYGTRFKIPLQITRYPLVMDASAFSNFVHHMFVQLTALAQKNKESTHAVQEEPAQESCNPPVF